MPSKLKTFTICSACHLFSSLKSSAKTKTIWDLAPNSKDGPKLPFHDQLQVVAIYSTKKMPAPALEKWIAQYVSAYW